MSPRPQTTSRPNLGSDLKKRPNSLERLHTYRLSILRTRTPTAHWASGRCSPSPLPLPTLPPPFYRWASGERWIGSRSERPRGSFVRGCLFHMYSEAAWAVLSLYLSPLLAPFSISKGFR